MSDLNVLPATPAHDVDAEAQAAYALAGRAVLACKYNRPTLRIESARLYPAVNLTFSVPVQGSALRAHRALLEETVMVSLAGAAAQQIKFGEVLDDAHLGEALALLRGSAAHEDEADASDAYLTILLARARGELRRSWAEVEIVTLGLRERGVLDGASIEHRVRCAGGIRSATLN